MIGCLEAVGLKRIGTFCSFCHLVGFRLFGVFSELFLAGTSVCCCRELVAEMEQGLGLTGD